MTVTKLCSSLLQKNKVAQQCQAQGKANPVSCLLSGAEQFETLASPTEIQRANSGVAPRSMPKGITLSMEITGHTVLHNVQE